MNKTKSEPVENVSWSELEEALEAVGSPFLSPTTMRYFDSRRVGDVLRVGGVYLFVTSERDRHATSPDSHYAVRRYTVRRFDASQGVPDVRHVGELGEYLSARAAGVAKYAYAEELADELLGAHK